MTDAVPVPEFSRLILVDHVSPAGVEQNLTAKQDERAALAKRFDLLELTSLKAQLVVTHGSERTIRVTGQIQADLAQACVVTLERLPSHLDFDVDVTFIPAADYTSGAGPADAEDVEEEFEVFSGGKIDLGEMVAQQLGITIDPYPRKEGAALGSVEFGTKIETRQPFAQLVEAVKNKAKPKG
jgi:uncharacterized metal-binding protein YceD (DUF177 family)